MTLDELREMSPIGDGSPEDIGERVLNGVRTLDYEYGTDWPHRICLGNLNMRDSADCLRGWMATDRTDCVRGQLAGDFLSSYAKSGESHDVNMYRAKLNGFLEDDDNNVTYRDLNVAWNSTIQALQEERRGAWLASRKNR